MLNQVAAQKFTSDCKKAVIIVENDMPVGSFHDFVMNIKGHMVDLMVKTHQEEQALAEQQKALDSSQEA